MSRVPVVDDEPLIRVALRENFARSGWDVETAPGAQEALDRFRTAPFPLVITDMQRPDGDGLAVLRGVPTLSPKTAVILLTGHGTVSEAVTAMKGGAMEYFVKPVAFQRLEDAARRVLSQVPCESALPAAGGIVGESVSMRRLMERVQQVAKTGVDVLLEAESGTGKELFARLIHSASSQRTGSFVASNCAAGPSTLFESELFGYVKGAFTGANSLHVGKFELASGGTLLLDEIGEMPLEHQPKLLRVLQQRAVDRLGGPAAGGRRCARGGYHEPKPQPDGRRRRISRRPLLSLERRHPAHSAAGRALHRQILLRRPPGLLLRRVDGSAPGLRLAGKRAGTEEYRAARAA